jgi:hypothetical protein
MLNFGEIYKSPNHARKLFFLAAAMLSIAACATTSTPPPSTEKPQLMFVQIAEDLKVDETAKTLRLVKVSQQTLYFSDRPVRIAGHLKMGDFLNEWTSKAGADNFGADPPNATLSVYQPGQPDNTVAVVEIMYPKIDGSDLIYTYNLIDGKLPTGGGATALFIDWIGVGGGVGPGFLGGGVGRRGPGVRGW